VFWDMNSISSRTEIANIDDNTTETVLYITVTSKTSADMAIHYNFTEKQKEALATLLDNLALLKWACTVLIEANNILHLNEPLAKKWEDIVRNLVDYPSNENGFMIGSEIPFNKSHRHYSHLLMFYPLHLISLNEKDYSEKIKKLLHIG